MGVAAMTDQIVGQPRQPAQGRAVVRASTPRSTTSRSWRRCSGSGCRAPGRPRSSFLLAQDPARRSLRVWEAGQPCPPPETATEHTDPRIAVAQAGIDFTNEMFPGFAGMLPTAADGPQECLVPMALDFRSLMFEGMALIPSYSAWLLQCDMEPAYRYHQRVLKLLQWRCPPKRWWLKSPAHMLSIDALDAVYPDARFVMTHRDVGKVLPSVCALYNTLARRPGRRPRRRSPSAPTTVNTWRTALGAPHRVPRRWQRAPVRRPVVRGRAARSDRPGRATSTRSSATSSPTTHARAWRRGGPKAPGTAPGPARTRPTSSGSTRTRSPNSSRSTPTASST